MSVRVTNITINKRKLDEILRNTPDQINDWMDGVAQEIVNDIKLSFGTSPSRPGDPPGVDTGALRASMRWARGGQYQRIIHDGVEYGVFLEYGTSKIAARPFVSPVFFEWQRKLADDAKRFGLIS